MQKWVLFLGLFQPLLVDLQGEPFTVSLQPLQGWGACPPTEANLEMSALSQTMS